MTFAKHTRTSCDYGVQYRTFLCSNCSTTFVTENCISDGSRNRNNNAYCSWCGKKFKYFQFDIIDKICYVEPLIYPKYNIEKKITLSDGSIRKDILSSEFSFKKCMESFHSYLKQMKEDMEEDYYDDYLSFWGYSLCITKEYLVRNYIKKIAPDKYFKRTGCYVEDAKNNENISILYDGDEFSWDKFNLKKKTSPQIEGWQIEFKIERKKENGF